MDPASPVVPRRRRNSSLAASACAVALATSLVGATLALAQPRPARERVILALQKPVTPEQRKELQDLGVDLLGYLGGLRYYAWAPADADVQLQILDTAAPGATVQAIPPLQVPLPPSWSVDEDRKTAHLKLSFFSDVSPGDAENALQSVAPNPTRSSRSVWSVEVPLAQLDRVPSIPGLKTISTGRLPFMPLNSDGRVAIRTEEAQAIDLTQPRPDFRVDGAGVAIGIFDSGIYAEHPDFYRVGADGEPTATLQVEPVQIPADLHGTLVASIAAGSGAWSDNRPNTAPWALRGHSPFARMGNYAPLEDSFAAGLQGPLGEDGIDVSNHSYAQSLAVYDVRAHETDEIVRGDVPGLPRRPQVWAAGNNGAGAQFPCHGWDLPCLDGEGYFSLFTSAKNTISVGSIDTDDGQLSPFSSLGPTLDGRIKPDVVAAGAHDSLGPGIFAANYTSDGYNFGTGTSMAAPSVAGAIGLMIQQCRISEKCVEPGHPSTYRALLIQTAIDQTKPSPYPPAKEYTNTDTGNATLFGPGPDFATGWGLVDAESARDLISRDSQWLEDEVDLEQDSDSWCIGVGHGSGALRVTLAWDDAASEACAPADEPSCSQEKKLVNDLDLLLTAPDGTTQRYPWLLKPPVVTGSALSAAVSAAPDASSSATEHDRLNNVERVDDPTPEAGWWRATVTAAALPLLDAPTQSYSLASTHPIQPGPCPAGDPDEDSLGPPAPPVLLRPDRAPDSRWVSLWEDILRRLQRRFPRPFPPSEGTIELANRQLRTGPRVERQLSDHVADATRPVTALVQLRERPSADVAAGLQRDGIRLGMHMGGGTYTARIAPDSPIRDNALVRWAGPLAPEDRMAPQLWRRVGTADPNRPEIAIIYFEPDVPPARRRVLVKRTAMRRLPHAPIGAHFVEIRTGRLKELATHPAVRWIEAPGSAYQVQYDAGRLPPR